MSNVGVHKYKLLLMTFILCVLYVIIFCIHPNIYYTFKDIIHSKKTTIVVVRYSLYCHFDRSGEISRKGARFIMGENVK